MIVPLYEDRYFGVEGAQIIIQEIVFVRGAELVESFGDLGLFWNRDVFPSLVIRQFYLGGDNAVGIDRIAGVEQEIGTMLAHGGEGKHAAIVRIDTPALPGNVAAPDKTDVAPVARGGSEATDHWLARKVDVREVAEFDAVENVLPRGQIFQQHLCRVVALGQRRDWRQNSGVVKRFRCGDFDDHLRWTVCTSPNNTSIDADIAGLNAMGDLWAVVGTAEIGHRD